MSEDDELPTNMVEVMLWLKEWLDLCVRARRDAK
jgi:hypothetical protein